MTAVSTDNLYDVLSERGLVAQTTDERIRDRLSQPVSAYIGFDPTADSLHVGSLVPVMALAWLQRCGHKPIALVGGATGLVGDPSGKTEARRMLTRDEIDANAAGIAKQIASVVRFGDDETGAERVNNADWLADLTWIEVLRDVGSRVSVNRMVSMDSVKGRLGSESGITYLEFSYMIMQAYDFVHLSREKRCTLQMGGQDQWGNIVMGIELGRKLDDADLAGLTMPLVTKADGSKFGKSEAGNVWLDPARTRPYDFYQFWRNTADADVQRFLACFTFLPMEEVNRLGALEGGAINQAKQTLAYEVTKLIHGEAEADKAKDSATRAFGSGDVSGESIPSKSIRWKDEYEFKTIPGYMREAGFVSSNKQAKQFLKDGGVRVWERVVKPDESHLTPSDIHEGAILLKLGKKKLFRFDVIDPPS
mgnify:CR=1 FL=1